MPKSVQPRAKADIHEIWMADTRQHATKAFDAFLEKYQAKYPVACECLAKDRDVLLAFYDFPTENWKHLRTTNPIESTFATIRLRQRRTKGRGSRRASLTMMFKLAQAAQKRWRRLNGHQHIVHLLEGKIFVNQRTMHSTPRPVLTHAREWPVFRCTVTAGCTVVALAGVNANVRG